MSDNSTTLTLGSTSAFVATLIPTLILFVVFIGLFINVRTKFRRVYEPKNVVQYNILPEEKPELAPSGAFSWVPFLQRQHAAYFIQYAGLEGYFFLRFLFLLSSFTFCCCFICLPLLLPIYATGGSGNKGFEILQFSNVNVATGTNKWKLVASALLSVIIHLGFVWSVYRELCYYVSMRHAAQALPYYGLLRLLCTLLLTELDDSLLENDGEPLRALFPSVKRITLARNLKELQKKCEERAKLGKKYENTVNKLIRKLVKIANNPKKAKKVDGPPNQFALYIGGEKKLPTHRLGKIPFIGKKVKTLDYGVEHTKELTDEITEMQTPELVLKQDKVGSAFLEFPNQVEAQRAYQSVPYNPAFKLGKGRRLIGVTPGDVIWSNLSMNLYMRWVRRIIANSVLTVTILFWAIPVAFVGSISQINNLISLLPWLGFINNLPHKLLGIITGLLPVVLMAVLMSLLPPYIRFIGKVGGAITVQEREHFCQKWYYAFQVVQVFLVQTLGSAATSVVKAIIDDPGSAMSLLSKNLPKASNFYVLYILLQGLSVSSGSLAQLVALVLLKILGPLLDKTPRAKFNRANSIGRPSWGTVYPVFGLLGVIMMVYAIIAPIILAFGVVAFGFFFLTWAYNLTFVLLPFKNDDRGRFFVRGVFMMFVGLYLAEVCLLGLFIMAKLWLALAIEVLVIVLTALSHVYLKWIFLPLMETVPVLAMLSHSQTPYPDLDQGLEEIKAEGQRYAEGSSELVELPKADPPVETTTDADGNPFRTPGHLLEQPRAGLFKEKADLDDGDLAFAPEPAQASPFQRFIHPRATFTFALAQRTLPAIYYDRPPPLDFSQEQLPYENPFVHDKQFVAWVGHDDLGLSTTEIAHADKYSVEVVDANTTVNEKGKMDYTDLPPDYEPPTRE